MYFVGRRWMKVGEMPPPPHDAGVKPSPLQAVLWKVRQRARARESEKRDI